MTGETMAQTSAGRLRPGSTTRLKVLAPALIGGCVLGVVVGQGLGLLALPQAAVLLFSPVIVVATALRPGWLVLFLAVVPISHFQVLPTPALVALLAGTLAAQLITRGRVYADFRSGLWPLIGLAIVARIFTTPLGGDSALVAKGFLDSFTFLVLLGLLAYNVTRLGDLKGEHLADALIAGAVLTFVLDRIGLAQGGLTGSAPSGISEVARNVAYLGAIALPICIGRLVLPSNSGKRRYSRLAYSLLAILFVFVTTFGLVRAAWVAAVVSILLLAHWAGKRRYWLVIPVVVVAVALIPAARERVLPGVGEEGVLEAVSDTSRVSTGRWDLWTVLWDDHIVPALPGGNGYGYTFSLSPERLFGFQTFQLTGSESPFVYPHNDFVFWALELGAFGALGLILFWVHLVRIFRRIIRWGFAIPTDVYLLSGVLVMTFVVQMVDNSFAIRPVSDRFFITAGYIFGVGALLRDRTRRDSTG